MEKKRSVGLKVFGSLLTGISLLYLICDLIAYIISPYRRPTLLSPIQSPFGIVLILLILQLVAGIGVLRLKNWGRRLVVWVAILYIILGSLFLGLAIQLGPIFAIILFAILLISFGISLCILFTRPKVKEQFLS